MITNPLSTALGADIESSADLAEAARPALVVFLVALPLSLGVALASGVPPALGLVSAIVGGLVVGRLSGSPLQVTGPAAGLAVVVWELVQTHGLAALGAIVFLAGLIQLAAGFAGLGRYFRAVSPAVVQGMLAGIGLLILTSQGAVAFGAGTATAVVGGLTIAAMLGWEAYRPERYSAVPGALVGVVLASTVALLFSLPVGFVELPSDLVGSGAVLSPASIFDALRSPAIWMSAGALAAVASAEAMLSATAVDAMHDGVRTDYDRELMAQGAGNIVSGFLGALPVTGVMVRSSVNVQSGAQDRLPGMMHAAALLVLVLTVPFLLQALPVAALAAVLVVTGWRLLAVDKVVALWNLDRTEAIILMSTALAIVGTDLLSGVLIGLGLAGARLLARAVRLDLVVNTDDDDQRVTLTLRGEATFVGVPELADALQAVPEGYAVSVDHAEVTYVDHAVIDLLQTWELNSTSRGNSLETEWPALLARYVDGDAPIARGMAA